MDLCQSVLVVVSNEPLSVTQYNRLFCHTGVSAALIFQQKIQAPTTQLRVVFDGDAVLFSDETDCVFREKGLEGAVEYEKSMEGVPMGEVKFLTLLIR